MISVLLLPKCSHISLCALESNFDKGEAQWPIVLTHDIHLNVFQLVV